jgi:hypothetical protein
VSAPGPVIATIVEGEGEVTALPIVLRRLAQETLGHWAARFPQPHRYNRNVLVAPGGIERIVGLVAVRSPEAGGILILLDADDDCPAILARPVPARPAPTVTWPSCSPTASSRPGSSPPHRHWPASADSPRN